MEGGKEVLWMVNKERFVQKKDFWFAEKGCFFSSCKASDKEKHFSTHNDTDFALQQN